MLTVSARSPVHTTRYENVLRTENGRPWFCPTETTSRSFSKGHSTAESIHVYEPTPLSVHDDLAVCMDGLVVCVGAYVYMLHGLALVRRIQLGTWHVRRPADRAYEHGCQSLFRRRFDSPLYTTSPRAVPSESSMAVRTLSWAPTDCATSSETECYSRVRLCSCASRRRQSMSKPQCR
jgi:hypothetical protein